MTDGRFIKYPEGEDSFEDPEGTPRFHYLYYYVAWHCRYERPDDMKVWRIMNAKAVDVANFYMENREIIKEKRAKYMAYNKKMYDREEVDECIALDQYLHYFQHMIRPSLEAHIQNYASRQKKLKAIEAREEAERDAIRKQHIKERTSTATSESIDQAIANKTLRIDQVRSEEDIVRYLCFHTKHQERAIRKVAHHLYTLKYMQFLRKSGKIEPVSMLVSGPSGIGKTELIELIRPLFYMEEQVGENAPCFIKLHFGGYGDVSHRNAITGTGVGYKGAEEPCLVDRLVAALRFINQRMTARLRNGVQYGADAQPASPIPPDIIILFVDEIDKPNPEVGVLNSLNSLLSNAYIKRASGNVEFSLPHGVTLFVYGTANFGANAMIEQKLDPCEIDAAKNLILMDMKRRGNLDCDIGRLGDIIPFFPLTEEQASEVMRFYIDRFFDTAQNYIGSVDCYFKMENESRDKMVRYFVHGNYVAALGMRDLHRLLSRELMNILIVLNDNLLRLLGPCAKETIHADCDVMPEVTFQVIGAEIAHSFEGLYANFNDLEKKVKFTDCASNNENLKACFDARSDIGLILFTCQPLEEITVNVCAPQSHRGVSIANKKTKKKKTVEEETSFTTLLEKVWSVVENATPVEVEDRDGIFIGSDDHKLLVNFLRTIDNQCIQQPQHGQIKEMDDLINSHDEGDIDIDEEGEEEINRAMAEIIGDDATVSGETTTTTTIMPTVEVLPKLKKKHQKRKKDRKKKIETSVGHESITVTTTASTEEDTHPTKKHKAYHIPEPTDTPPKSPLPTTYETLENSMLDYFQPDDDKEKTNLCTALKNTHTLCMSDNLYLQQHASKIGNGKSTRRKVFIWLKQMYYQ